MYKLSQDPITIDVGAYGKKSDGGIFSNSNLPSKLEVEALGVQKLTKLPGADIRMPHILLGDPAYPLKPFLMRPFPVTKLELSETIFNEHLSKARQVIECTFGIITNKLRLLQKAIDVNLDFADKIVKCILCLLNNIIIDRERYQELLLMSNQANKSDNRFASVSAYIIKENYFCTQELVN